MQQSTDNYPAAKLSYIRILSFVWQHNFTMFNAIYQEQLQSDFFLQTKTTRQSIALSGEVLSHNLLFAAVGFAARVIVDL